MCIARAEEDEDYDCNEVNMYRRMILQQGRWFRNNDRERITNNDIICIHFPVLKKLAAHQS